MIDSSTGLPADGGFDFGNVVFSHLNHHRKSTLGFVTARGHDLGEHPGGGLLRNPPVVPAPPAAASLTAIAEDGVPITVNFFLRVRRHVTGRSLAVLEFRAAVQP